MNTVGLGSMGKKKKGNKIRSSLENRKEASKVSKRNDVWDRQTNTVSLESMGKKKEETNLEAI